MILTYMKTHGVLATLIDASTQRPISNMDVKVTVDNHLSKVVSSVDGRITIKPRMGVAVWMVGNIAYSPHPVSIEIENSIYDALVIPPAQVRQNTQGKNIMLGKLLVKGTEAKPSSTSVPGQGR